MKFSKWMITAALAFSATAAVPADGLGNQSFALAAADKTAPAAPSVNKVTDQSAAIKGKAESGARVLAYAGKTKLGDAIAAKGVYSIKIAKQKAGTPIAVYALDAAKNKSKISTAKVAASAVKYETTAMLNMRTGASVKYGVIAVIPKGQTVEYASKNGSWFKVKYGTKTGWVNSAYLKKPGASAYPAPSAKTPGTVKSGVLVVNKKYGLPSTYNPGINAIAQRSADAMLADAKKQGIYLQAISTYRSYSYQASLYANYIEKYGQKEADRFAAKPGFSEHQTGLAFDFGGKNNNANWLEGTFGKTKEGKWLAANAHKYGFILRYPKGKESITGYMYEPWHFRYIGGDIAAKVKASGLTLEEYLGIQGK